MIRIAIVEDNASDTEALKKLIARYFETRKKEYQIQEYNNAENFLDSKMNFDIMFLDIELSGMNGMNAAKRVRLTDSKSVIIFTTYMRQYAIKGYEVGALNYLLKPVHYSGFSLTMDKALPIVDVNNESFLRVSSKDGIRQLNCRDILYIDIVKHDVVIHCTNENLFLYGILSEYEKKLSGFGFAKCSSNTLVNLRHVNKVVKDDVYIADDVLHISRRMKKSFLNQMTIFLGENI